MTPRPSLLTPKIKIPMQKEKKGKHFIQNPVYEGGLKAMRAFISQHKKYPDKALKEKVEGTVFIKYTINYKGKVIDAKVLKSLGGGCDEEAVRIVKLLKFHVPKNRGIKVKFFKNIQIHFRLPKKKEKPQSEPQQQQQISYTVTTSQPKKEVDKEEKGGGGYTIKINY